MSFRKERQLGAATENLPESSTTMTCEEEHILSADSNLLLTCIEDASKVALATLLTRLVARTPDLLPFTPCAAVLSLEADVGMKGVGGFVTRLEHVSARDPDCFCLPCRIDLSLDDGGLSRVAPKSALTAAQTGGVGSENAGGLANASTAVLLHSSTTTTSRSLDKLPAVY
jgi:hypothetical protein